MHWRLKASVQNAVSLLPSSASYSVYYWIQRRFGNLRRADPTSRMRAALLTWRKVQDRGADPVDKVFFEVGTGRVAIVPIAYWLLGARRTISMDLNAYLKDELVLAAVQYLGRNRSHFLDMFGTSMFHDRFEMLVGAARRKSASAASILDLCCITYVAPGDAADTALSAASVDYHTSYTVFEHVPPNILHAILTEGRRIVRPGGLFIHRIDYTDHFAHSDGNISPINFLQYSDAQWDRIAGNRYMYMNRLRHDDYVKLFESAGHEILVTETDSDASLMQLLQTRSLHLDSRFRDKAEHLLATTASWIVSRDADGALPLAEGGVNAPGF